MAEVTISKGVVIDYCPLIIEVLTRITKGQPVEKWELNNSIEEMRRIQHYLNQPTTK
jgi:hypothetical protein